jgi:hypothetical protein
MRIRSVGVELFHANGQTDGNDTSRSCERAQRQRWVQNFGSGTRQKTFTCDTETDRRGMWRDINTYSSRPSRNWDW